MCFGKPSAVSKRKCLSKENGQAVAHQSTRVALCIQHSRWGPFSRYISIKLLPNASASANSINTESSYSMLCGASFLMPKVPPGLGTLRHQKRALHRTLWGELAAGWKPVTSCFQIKHLTKWTNKMGMIVQSDADFLLMLGDI